MTEQAFYRAIGQRIRKAREAKGWTQLRLGMEVGVQSSVAVHYWETGRHRPSLWFVRRIEAATGQEVAL